MAVFKVGDKVRARPSTAAYRRGDKDGEVVKVGKVQVKVRLTSGIVVWFPTNLLTTRAK